MAAHALLASTLAGAVFFGGFVLTALIGIPMQDRKLLERHGNVYGAYLSDTSVVPFAATPGSSGDVNQRVWPAIATAVTGTGVLAALHPIWHLGHGAPFAAIVLIGGLAGVVKQLRRRTKD
ncbi:MAG: NnrU family protein [Woeseiaceae bacterium]|nr:NnrU family protein [Woeseiaceae bacterium]